MNVIVCLKQVPDTESVIKVKPDGSGIETEGLKYVINPYDEFAVEEALRTKEKLGGEVTIVCVGPDRAVESIRMALAMGADKAVHLNDPALFEGDALTTAKALAAAIKQMPYDLIFCGKQAVDDDMAQVGPALAQLLGIPHVSVINKFEVLEGGRAARVTRQVEGGEEVVECPLPALFTCQKGLNEPRYASLPGIMKAKKKPLETKDLAALGLSADEVGAKGAKVKAVRYYAPPERQPGRIIEGETVEERVSQLVKLLRDEAKVI